MIVTEGIYKKIEIFYADSGGGHKSVADAIYQAMISRVPSYKISVVNGTQYGNDWYAKLTDLYKYSVLYARSLYTSLYNMTNGVTQTRVLERLIKNIFAVEVRRYLEKNDIDLFISCHPFFNLLMPHFVHENTDAKFVSVITDPITPHAHNFSPNVDLCIVSSDYAKDIALKQGLDPMRIKVIGHPVSPDFVGKQFNKKTILHDIGLSENKCTILISGGADGLGRIYDTVKKLASSALPVQLIVICGRNKSLYKRIEKNIKNENIKIFAYTNMIADLMRSADILIAKPGASTMYEAFAVGLPIIIYDVIIGQELGNMSHITGNHAGVYCENIESVVDEVEKLVNYPHRRESMSIAAKKLSNNDAVIKIVDECLSLISDSSQPQFEHVGLTSTEDAIHEIYLNRESRHFEECPVT